MSDQKKTILAKLLLFSATIIWGSSFFIMKNAVEDVPVFYLLCFRFLTGAAVLLLLSVRKLRQLNAGYFFRGTVMGTLLFLAYVSQTFGIMDTTPGKNAFLTTVYCIIVPFLYWAVSRIRPDRYNIAASFICLAGIGLVAMDGSFSIRTGDLLTLLSGLFFAMHIVSVALFSRKYDIFLLTLIQFFSAAVLGGMLGLLFEDFPTQIPSGSLWSVIYLCLFATAAALLMQNIGQKYTPPSTAALILSLEAVFGVIFSLIFYHEKLTLRITIGFSLIFLAVIISETKLVFARRVHIAQKK